MPSRWVFRAVITLLTLPALAIALGTIAVADMHNPLEKRLADTRTKEQKIDIEMSAGPPEIAKAARVTSRRLAANTALRQVENGRSFPASFFDPKIRKCSSD
jgi:hypothetical protein